MATGGVAEGPAPAGESASAAPRAPWGGAERPGVALDRQPRNQRYRRAGHPVAMGFLVRCLMSFWSKLNGQ
jgi:hypothetical protein